MKYYSLKISLWLLRTKFFASSRKILKFSVLQMIIASFDAQMAKYTFKAERKRKYHRESRVSKAEIMVIMILFHSSGYRCLKHFYLEKVCKHMRHLFPEVVSYNRFVELEREKRGVVFGYGLLVFAAKQKSGLVTICNINAFIMQYQRFCFAMSQMLFSHVSAQVSFQNSLDTLTNNKTTKQLWCPVSDWRRACITVLPPLCRMPQCHRQVIALLVARTVRHRLLTWLETGLTTPHRMGHFMHLFSPWQNTSKLALPIWLNENVHLRSAQ